MANQQPQNQHNYSERITYLDGSSLLRPQTLQGSARFVVLILLAIAAVIGISLAIMFARGVVYAGDIEKAEVAAVCKDASLETLPQLTSLMPQSVDDRIAALTVAGNKLVTIPNTNGDSTTISLVRLNGLADENTVIAFFQKQGSGFHAIDAVKVLRDSWNVTMDSEDSSVMKLRYADFSSKTMDSAFASALTMQGFTVGPNAASGKDDNGNTYMSDAITINDVIYEWRVSTVPLSDYYRVNGLPATAYFMVVTINRIA